ncbi:MAG TPA: hypothetical protein VHN99_09925 [Deinococcales bacterium]|nr:hypothetical protein [Deinococcales bacterium]
MTGPGSGDAVVPAFAIVFGLVCAIGSWAYLSIRVRVFQNGFEWRTIVPATSTFANVSVLRASHVHLDMAFKNGGSTAINRLTIGNGRAVCQAIVEGVHRDNPAAIDPSVYRHFGLPPYGLLEAREDAQEQPST